MDPVEPNSPKHPRKNKPKSKAKPKAAPGLRIGKLVKVGTVKTKPHPRRTTGYEPVIEQMRKMRPGQEFEVPPMKGVSVEQFQGRLNAAMIRDNVKAPKGARFRKEASEAGGLVIKCLRK